MYGRESTSRITLNCAQGLGMNGSRQPMYPVQHDTGRSIPIPKVTDMSGLEALVAVATSEEKAAPIAHH